MRYTENKQVDMNNRVYAFDFFDTIVHRDCHPEVILYEWAKKCSRWLNYRVSSSELYFIRKKIEVEEKKNKNVEELSYESLIKKIYSKIEDKIDVEFGEFFSFISSTEISIELRHVYQNTERIDEIKQLVENGNRVIIISDFYAGKAYISDILRFIGIHNLISNIYVSSDLNKRKSSGTLYEYVLKQLEISSDKLIMCGDNPVSDISIPKRMGISSVLRAYQNPHKCYDKDELKRLYRKELFSKPDESPLSGYAGELIYFISELYKELVKGKNKQVFFCSREGQLMKTIFDLYQNLVFGDTYINSHYFFVSRRALLLPSLRSLEVEKFERIFRQFKQLKVSDFFSSIGIKMDEAEQLYENLPINPFDFITSSDNDLIMKKVRSSEMFKKIYDRNREYQKKCFLSYVTDCGINLDNDVIILADIGWKGTIQDCIVDILPSTCKVVGYYLGLRTSEFKTDNLNNKYGILFSEHPTKCKNYKLLERGYMFYERIFAADHGPVLGYLEDSEGIIQPIINEDEIELKLYKYIEQYQSKLIKTMETLIKAYILAPWDPYELYKCMITNCLWRQCVFFPKIWKVEKIARTLSRENFGDISKNEKKVKEQLGYEQFKKMDLFFADYSFRILEKFHMTSLFPLAEIYCRFVYILLKLKLLLSKSI